MIDVNTREYRQARIALGIGGFLIFSNLYLFQSLLPVMAETFSVSATRVNWLIAGGSLALALTLIPWAICSEIIGRYRVMMISLCLMPLVGLLALFTDSLFTLTLARIAMGVALAGFTAVAVAYMADEFTPTGTVNGQWVRISVPTLLAVFSVVFLVVSFPNSGDGKRLLSLWLC